MSPNPDSLFSTFDYPFDSEDPSAIEDYRSTLEDFRHKAWRTPLGSPTVFPLKLQLKAQYSANSRPVPWFAREASIGERTFSCRLLDDLHIGLDRHSQIWVAEVLHDGARDISDQSLAATPSKIVLKIFQQSLSTLPTVESILNMDGTYVVLEEHARNEELAYSILKKLQGTYVPYCYGLHEITLPTGEQAWILALEYIDGIDIQQLGRTCKLPKDAKLDPVKQSDLCEVYRSATRAVRAVQDLKVHRIVNKANDFIVMHNNFVVLVDFAISDFNINRRSRVGGMLHSCQCILDSLADYQDAVQSWVNIHLRKGLRGYVNLPVEYYKAGYCSSGEEGQEEDNKD